MSKLNITREYEDNNPNNTITQAKLTSIATEINDYFNTGNITGDQVRVDGLDFSSFHLTDFVDRDFFEIVDSAFKIANRSDSNLSEMDGDVLLGDEAVTWDKHITQAGSVSFVTADSNDYVRAAIGSDSQLNYRPLAAGANTSMSLPTGSAEVPLFIRDDGNTNGADANVIHVTSTGRPLCICVVPGSTSSNFWLQRGASGSSRVRLQLFRVDGAEDEGEEIINNGTLIQRVVPTAEYIGDSGTSNKGLPPIVFYDFTGVAGNTYSYVITSDANLATSNNFYIDHMKLVVYEII